MDLHEYIVVTDGPLCLLFHWLGTVYWVLFQLVEQCVVAAATERHARYQEEGATDFNLDITTIHTTYSCITARLGLLSAGLARSPGAVEQLLARAEKEPQSHAVEMVGHCT